MNPVYANGPAGFSFQLDEFYLDLQENGRRISMLSKEEITQKPFPGLRPFKTSEFQLYNGRLGQSEELIKRLKKNHFLAVIGSSGTGKSSLVRAGLIPQLFGGYLHGAGSKWDIAICRPGKNPLENLAVALAGIKARSKDPQKIAGCFDEFNEMLDSSIYGVLDARETLAKEETAGEQNPAADGPVQPANLLIIVDQFEELFRFDRKNLGKENIENHFVNLLLKASLDPSKSIYVIITMRSEFLGDCVKYRGLPEAINDGQYLVPQLTRSELKDVIENPIRLAGKKISPDLVELLVNEIEDSRLQESLDQLPILQHALMRTYNEAMKDGPDTEITYEHYRRIGEMEKALANHAETKFKELGNGNLDEKLLTKKQKAAKIIFQTLTDLGADLKGGRRPTELRNIYAIAGSSGISEADVNEVVNHFRDTDTSFIMPPINTLLYPNLIIDISHESLMRNWLRLNEWISEEVKRGNLYRLLNERRLQHDQDPEDWLRGILLRELTEWENDHPDSATWATRYHSLPKRTATPAMHQQVYRKNIEFLKESVGVNEKLRIEEQNELKQNIAREQREKSIKKMLRVLVIASVISVLFGIWAFAERNNSAKQRKIAELSAADASRQRTIAEANANEASRSAAVATEQRRIAVEQQKKADSSARIARVQSAELAKYAEEARLQKNTALVLRDSAERKKEDFQKQLVKNALKNEPFYFSSSLDQAAKEAIIDSLFKTPSFDTRQIQLAKYIDLDLLKLINEMVEVKERVKEAPGEYLSQAMLIWSASGKNSIIKNLLLGIVNENIFSGNSAQIQITGNTAQVPKTINLEKTNLAVSNNQGGFAFNNGRQVVSGKMVGGKLQLDESSFDDQFSRLFCAVKNNIAAGKPLSGINYSPTAGPVALIDSFKIKTGGAGEPDSISVVNGLPNYNNAFLSPDASLAVLMDNDGNLFLKNTTAAASTQKLDTIGNYRNKTLGTENISFASNSQYLFFNMDGKGKMIDRKNRIVTMSDWDTQYIDAASFAADGKSLLMLADGKMSMRDTLLNKQPGLREIDFNAGNFLQAGIQPDKVKTLQLSSDWKRVLVTQNNDRNFLVEARNNDSLFSKTNATDNIGIKEVGSNKQKLRLGFANDSTLVSVQENGTITAWPVYNNFTVPELAVPALMPEKNFQDKLRDGDITFDNLLSSGTPQELNLAAEYYIKSEQADYAKKLYQKLLDRAPQNMRGYYLGKILQMNQEMNTVDRINSKLDPKRLPVDTIMVYRQIKVNRLKENIKLEEEQSRLCVNKEKFNNDLSLLYGSLAFNQLFVNDYEGAIQSSMRGLNTNPKNDWINTNLALGYLLNGKYAQAEVIYKKYKNETFADKSRTFKNAFLGDLRDMEEAGVLAKDKQFMTDATKIRKLLE